MTVTNTLSFDRSDVIVLDYSGKIVDGGYRQQVYTDVRGNKKLMVGGVTVPAFSSITLKLVDGKPEENSAFSLDDNSLETPFASVKFADNGTISSFVDKRADREICGDGYNLNTFIMAEDFPSEWDNWDVDADIEMKFEDVSKLVSREVVSNGSVALVIRSKYAISGKSTVTQDMIFFADSAEVRFDTVMDWQDNHRFLKTAFDTSVRQEFARFDVQFGNVKRPTTRNNSVERQSSRCSTINILTSPRPASASPFSTTASTASASTAASCACLCTRAVCAPISRATEAFTTASIRSCRMTVALMPRMLSARHMSSMFPPR